MIFGGSAAYESKRKQKLTAQEINAVMPVTPKYLKWSEVTITFDRSDHPDNISHLGRYPLVLDPIGRTVKLNRVLIDWQEQTQHPLRQDPRRHEDSKL